MEIEKLLKNHLVKNKLWNDYRCWEINDSPFGGRGMFALRDIEAGEIILEDYPVLLGPRNLHFKCKVCTICGTRDDIDYCKQNTGLLVCKACEDTQQHKKECAKIKEWMIDPNQVLDDQIIQCLTPIRAYFLDENDQKLVKSLVSHRDPGHGFEIDVLTRNLGLNVPLIDQIFLKEICSVLDANTFEVLHDNTEIPSLRGLYSLSTFINHRCVPNATHVFNSQRKMIVKAATFIKKGDEIFCSYSRLIWGTTVRHHYLQETKHFSCKCARCLDPTEFGSYLNAVLCSLCEGNMVPKNPVDPVSVWNCQDCKNIEDAKKIGFITSVMGHRLANIDDEDVESILKFFHEKLLKFVPNSNHIVMELKYRLIWMLGHRKGYFWPDLSERYLQIKSSFCKDILHVLDILGVGLCKFKGLLKYELAYCLREEYKRKFRIKDGNLDIVTEEEKEMTDEIDKLLQEASYLFLYDSGTPKEIKELWTNVDNSLL